MFTKQAANLHRSGSTANNIQDALVVILNLVACKYLPVARTRFDCEFKLDSPPSTSHRDYKIGHTKPSERATYGSLAANNVTPWLLCLQLICNFNKKKIVVKLCGVKSLWPPWTLEAVASKVNKGVSRPR